MAKETNKRLFIWINNREIENNIKAIQAEFNKVKNELKQATRGSEEYNQKLKELKKLKGILDEHKKAVQTVAEAHAESKKNIQNSAMAWGGVAAAIQGVSVAVRRFVAATQEYVDAYARMDDAMTNVSKYTGLTREEVEQLNEEFRKMDTRTPTEKLNALAADAGRLGITSKEAIKDFVEAADIINVALGEDLGEDAVKEIGKLAEMFGTTNTMGLRGAMLATGSAINTLAQSSSASERYLMDFTSRLSGAANQAKMTQAEVLGFASVLDQNKQQVEMSATAMQKLMMDMFTEPAKYAKLAGMSVKDFSDLLKNDANEALLTFFETLNRKGGLSDLAPIFDKLGLDGARASGVISVLAQNIDDVRKEQELANTAFQEGTSVINEAAAVNSNAAAQLEKAKKRMQDAKAELGKELIPILTKLTNVLSSSTGFISKNISLVKQALVVFGAYFALVSKTVIKEKIQIMNLKAKAAMHALNNKVMAASNLIMGSLQLAYAKMTKNQIAAVAATKKLNAAMSANPWGLILTAIIAVVKAIQNYVTATGSAEQKTAAFFQKYKNDADAAYAKEEIRIKNLLAQLDSENVSRERKLSLIEQLQQVAPDYHATLSKEGELIDDNREKIEKYLKAFHKKVELEALQSAYVDAMSLVNQYDAKFQAEKDAATNGPWYQSALAYAKRITVQFPATLFHKLGLNPDQLINPAPDVLANEAREIAAVLKKQMDAIMKDPEYIAALSAGEDHNGNGNGNGDPDGTTTDNLEERREAFRKRLADYYQSIRDANLDEFSKLREEILKKDAELYKEMNDLGMGDELLPTLNAARDEAFKKMTHDLVAKYQKASFDIMDAIRKTVGEDFSNKLEEELNKDEKRWDDATIEVWNNINSLSDILNHLEKTKNTPEELNEVNKAIKVQEALLKEIEKKKIESKAAIIKKNYEEVLKFAQEKDIEQRRAAELAGKTEKEQAELRKQWRIQEIQEEYDIRIRLAKAELEAKEALNDGDEEGLQKIRDLITELKRLKKEVPNMVDNEGKAKQTPKDEGLLSLFNISSMDPWEENLKRAVNALEELRATAMDVFNSMVEMQQNAAEQELNRFTEAQDAKSRKLQQQLEEGLISQKYYDAQMEKMEAEREKKEKQIRHDEWDREHQASLVNAIAAGALAASNSLANGGGVPWGLIPMGISLITTGANIALIASQVNPYAKGGYIRKKQLALVGEKGPEWVASNTLLEDKETAPVIAALEDYQRGNRTPLRMVAPTQPAWKNLSQSASQISSTFASNRTPVVHHHYQTAGGDELLKEVKQMNQFLADPKNRQAYISYKIQTEAQKNRDFIKQAAKL